MYFRVKVLSGCKRCGRNACAGCAVRGVIATGASRRRPEPGPDGGLRQGGRFESDRAPWGRRVMGSRANGARSSVSLTREHGRGGARPSSRLSTHFRDPAGNGRRSEPESDDQPRPDDEARSNARVERCGRSVICFPLRGTSQRLRSTPRNREFAHTTSGPDGANRLGRCRRGWPRRHRATCGPAPPRSMSGGLR